MPNTLVKIFAQRYIKVKDENGEEGFVENDLEEEINEFIKDKKVWLIKATNNYILVVYEPET